MSTTISRKIRERRPANLRGTLRLVLKDSKSFAGALPGAKHDSTSAKMESYSFWVVRGNERIGTVQIRMKATSSILPALNNNIYYEILPSVRRMGYGTQALHLALKKAHELGLDDIVVICRSSNIGSKRVIEKNRGLLIRSVATPTGIFLKYRFQLRKRSLTKTNS